MKYTVIFTAMTVINTEIMVEITAIGVKSTSNTAAKEEDA